MTTNTHTHTPKEEIFRFGNIFPQPCLNSLRFVRRLCASSVWKRQRDTERLCPPAPRRGYVRRPVRGRFLICPRGNEQMRRKRKQTLNLFCSRGHEIQNLMKEQVRQTASAKGESGRAHLKLQYDSEGPLTLSARLPLLSVSHSRAARQRRLPFGGKHTANTSNLPLGPMKHRLSWWKSLSGLH